MDAVKEVRSEFFISLNLVLLRNHFKLLHLVKNLIVALRCVYALVPTLGPSLIKTAFIAPCPCECEI